MIEKSLEVKILESLLSEPKTFSQLLKSIVISRPTLAKKLNAMEKEGFVSHEGSSQKTPWKVNKLNLGKSELNPKVVAALLFQVLQHSHYELYLNNNELKRFENEEEKILREGLREDGKIDQSKIDNEAFEKIFEQEKAEMSRICDESIEKLEKAIGIIVLNLLVFQDEKDVKALEILDNFIRFTYIAFIKKDEWIKESVRKSEPYKEIKTTLELQYPDIEKDLLKLVQDDVLLNRSIIQFLGNNRIDKTFVPKALHIKDEFYEELGYPFNILYKNASGIIEFDKNKKLKG